ncbi:hypothetical protein [Halorussus halophilus]|uniref:hypothetical protein n=1 Tax=Halorussus halophilus TaxID=2650975 RepID=UPI0037433716
MKAVAAFVAVAVILGTLFGVSQVTTNPALDLQEANVVSVEVEDAGDGGYTFDVTLYHDDDGEDGYANWWQVETLNGTELGRRELLHAHGTEPFTRSTLVEIPENVSLVVVRGHDQTHGYGGQAMVVNLRTGAAEAVRQGSEQRNFSECAVLGDSTAGENSTTLGNGTVSGKSPDIVRCPWESGGNETATPTVTSASES